MFHALGPLYHYCEQGSRALISWDAKLNADGLALWVVNFCRCEGAGRKHVRCHPRSLAESDLNHSRLWNRVKGLANDRYLFRESCRVCNCSVGMYIWFNHHSADKCQTYRSNLCPKYLGIHKPADSVHFQVDTSTAPLNVEQWLLVEATQYYLFRPSFTRWEGYGTLTLENISLWGFDVSI